MTDIKRIKTLENFAIEPKKMKDKYDIFDFKLGQRPDGRKVVEIHVKLGIPGETYLLGYLTDYQIDRLVKFRIEDL